MSKTNSNGYAALLAALGGIARRKSRRRERKPAKVRNFAELRERFLQRHGQNPIEHAREHTMVELSDKRITPAVRIAEDSK